MKLNWETILQIGSILGFSFLYVVFKDIIKYFFSPKLKILKLDRDIDIRVYRSVNPPIWTRKFVTLHVKNFHRTTAIRCIATLEFFKHPQNVQFHERQYNLHWADVPYSLRTTGAEPINIGREIQRLDVVFTDANVNVSGCQVSMPMALTNPANTPQAVLPPGTYYVYIRVSCENGKDAKGRYKIISPERNNPNDWQNLDFEKLKGFKNYLEYLKAKLTAAI